MELTQEQQAAVAAAAAGNVVVVAGPGAGKSTVLAAIHLELLRDFLVTVFSYTNAAADAFNSRSSADVAVTMHRFCANKLNLPGLDVFQQARTLVLLGPSRATQAFLVDEAQDCNAAQFEFLAALMDRGARVICVGDAQQSIFGFQGAAPRLLRDFGRSAPVELRTNRRSVPAMVSAFNVFAHHNFLLPLEQEALRTSDLPGPRFAIFENQEALYADVARLHRAAPKLTAVLVMSNASLDEAHVKLFVQGVPAITFSAERSDEFSRVPEELRCAEVLQLLTVWGSKGHEFERVVLLGANDLGAGETPERARLLFVAMTRAVDELHVLTTIDRPFSRHLHALLPPDLPRPQGAADMPPPRRQIKKIAAQHAEGVLRAVFGDDRPGFHADEILYGTPLRAPTRGLTRLGLETTYGVVLEAMAWACLSPEPEESHRIRTRKTLLKPFLRRGAPEKKRRDTIRSRLNTKVDRYHAGWSADSLRAALQASLRGTAARVSYRNEPEAVRSAGDDLVALVADISRERPEASTALETAIADIRRYNDCAFLLRDEQMLDADPFAAARQLILQHLAMPEFEGFAARALGIAVVAAANKKREDFSVLRALTHLCAPPDWPEGLRIKMEDLSVDAEEGALRTQAKELRGLRGADFGGLKREQDVCGDIGDTVVSGRADMLGSNIVLEVKATARIEKRDVLQVLIYALLSHKEFAVLWDTRAGRLLVWRMNAKQRCELRDALERAMEHNC